MAETLSPSGIVIPRQTEPISAGGVEEMRTLGATANTALADKASLAQLAAKADKSVVDDMLGKMFLRGTIPSGSDLDTWVDESRTGLWRTTAGVSPTLSGVPEEHKGQPFQLLHLGSQPRVTSQMLIPYGYYSSAILIRSIDDISTNTWTDWAPLGGGSVEGSGESPWTPNHARKALFTQAMGGPIDTGGLGVVALRFDHGLKNFRDKVLPAVKARGMKVSMAYNPRRWHLAENAGVTAADLNGWVAAGDVEIWNHSATHIAAETPDALRDEIVNGLAEIEAELPAARGQVWGFNPPGFTNGDYMGFNDGRTPEGWDTYAGRLILQHHAVASGYLAGTQIRPLDGTIRDGQSHFTIDGMTVADLKGHIDSAVAQRGGLQLMLHPSQLDLAGKLTTAQFVEVLDYIVAKRSAGELVTLSPYQMMVADSTRPPVTIPDVAGLVARLAALEYDTGWRIVTPDAGVTGTIKVKRTASGAGDRTTLRIEGVLPPAGSGSVFLATLPAGFRHTGEHWLIADGRAAERYSLIGLYNGSRVAWVQDAAGGVTRPTDPISAEYTWESPDARPTTLPPNA